MSEGRWIDGYMTCEEAGRVAEDLPAAEVFAGTRAAAEAAAMEWIKQRSGF